MAYIIYEDPSLDEDENGCDIITNCVDKIQLSTLMDDMKLESFLGGYGKKSLEEIQNFFSK